MIGNSFHQLFMLGANKLVAAGIEFGPIQQEAGFTKTDWDLLTSVTCWTQSQRQQIPGLIANAVSITLNIAGLPATPLPGAFVAATICKIVAPCNRLVAAAGAPESFDALSASGLHSESVKVITTKEQMYSLVTYMTSEQFGALSSFRLNQEIEDAVIEAQANGI